MPAASPSHPVADFAQNASSYIDRLKLTGKPEALTVNGQPELIIQSADGYQKLLDDAELARSLRVIRQSLEDAEAGKVRPAKEFIEGLAAKNGFDVK
ncbi:MAG TPA: hypothetical protein VFE47_30935 [Tepidisphaeraceae bacterium]|jgi:PHD/YefM family antitoxin component YafN of YafNO toxin-antitoxin module|nr:hypothetical protein [Tepidisphaeraceae bacterium]